MSTAITKKKNQNAIISEIKPIKKSVSLKSKRLNIDDISLEKKIQKKRTEKKIRKKRTPKSIEEVPNLVLSSLRKPRKVVKVQVSPYRTFFQRIRDKFLNLKVYLLHKLHIFRINYWF